MKTGSDVFTTKTWTAFLVDTFAVSNRYGNSIIQHGIYFFRGNLKWEIEIKIKHAQVTFNVNSYESSADVIRRKNLLAQVFTSTHQFVLFMILLFPIIGMI